jgi:very-short-patch-repair endonuclease
MDSMTNLNRRLASVANGQLGIVSRGQARAVSGSNRQLRRRVQSGILNQVGPNSYRLPGAPPGQRGDLRALLLDIGDDVWASGPTAAALHGFDGFALRAPFDVTTLRGRNVRRIGHRVHTTTQLDLIDRSTVDGFATLSPARTVIDLARHCSVEELVVAIDSGRRDGGFNDDLLLRRVFALAGKGRAGIPQLLDAIHTLDFGRGGHSWLEREFLRLLADARLPLPDTQQVLTRAQDRLVRVDFRFPGTNLVVEVLGFRYHRTTEQIARDTARMNALTTDGFRVYQYTYATVVDDSIAMLMEIRQALAP